MKTPEFSEELPWPPEQPPEYQAVKDAWAKLHSQAIAYAKRKLPLERSNTRRLLKVIRPKQMRVRLITEEQHENGASDALRDEEADFRPAFDQTEPDEQSYEDIGEDDEGQGDLAMVNIELYTADTRFCIALSLEWKETKTGANADDVDIVEYEHRRISVHPDAAAYLISRLKEKERKTIADALVFQLIRDDGERLADEEYADGGFAPIWRTRENDPALDSIRLCEHLRTLYMRLVAGQHPQEHMNDDPDAPKEPKGT
jgi:hypothetical protein